MPKRWRLTALRIPPEAYRRRGFPAALGRLLAVLNHWRDRLRRRSILRSRKRDYARWMALAEPGPEALQAQREAAGVRFLIVQCLPGCEAGRVLERIQPLLAQTYPGWKAWVGVSPEALPSLSSRPDQEGHLLSRLRFFPLDDHHGFPAETPRIDAPDFIIPLDPDMMLAAHALHAFAMEIEGTPEAERLYADEDLLDPGGARHSPWFKPDWSPELLYSVNYLHPAVLRADRFWDVWPGGLWPDGWWDWPALLEALPGEARRIRHVPQVLMHRLTSGDGLPPFDERRSRARIAHRTWIEHRLRRGGAAEARAADAESGWPQVSWRGGTPPVSVIVPTAGEPELLGRCLEGLTRRTEYPDLEVVLVTGEGAPSSEAPFSGIHEGRVRVLGTPGGESFNYSRANNLGARAARGSLLLFLNDDVEVIEAGWLTEMARWAETPGIGVVGANLLYPDGRIQHAGVIVGMGGHAAHVFRGAPEVDSGPYGSTVWYRNFSAVTGACMMIRREVFEQVGGFDEGYELVFSDIDLCLRVLTEGLRVMVTPFARLIHNEGASRGAFMPTADMVRAAQAFRPLIESGDPYYNPHLSYRYAYPRVRTVEEDRAARLQAVLAGTGAGPGDRTER